jgi:choline transport protein
MRLPKVSMELTDIKSRVLRGLLRQVEPRTLLPLYSIGLSTVISLLLALINIGSDTAFNAMISLVISAYYAAFSISAAVLLYKRLTTPPNLMEYGPFSLGRAGIPIIIGSLIYSMVGIFFSFWPEDSVVDAHSMNWSIVVSGAMFLFSLVFWFTHGRKAYTGPVPEII